MVVKKINKNIYSSSKKNLLKKKISEAVLSMLKTESFSKLAIKKIFKKAKIKPLEGLSIIKTKREIFLLLNDYFDQKNYFKIQNIENVKKREKIFEILMIRFEIYNQHRIAVIKIFNYIINKSDLIIFFLPFLSKSLSSCLEFSGIEKEGVKGKIRFDGIFIIFILVFLVWRKDNTLYLDKTMATLDNYLDKGENLINLFNIKN